MKKKAVALLAAMMCMGTALAAPAAQEGAIPYPVGQKPNGEGAWSAPQEINHADSPYFVNLDVYNMESINGRRVVMPHYPSYQQTTEYTCGPAAALPFLDGRRSNLRFGRIGTTYPAINVSTSGGYNNNSENVTKIWDARTGKLHKELKGHSGVVTCAVVNPNGKEVASSSWDGTIKIWSLEDGVLIRTLNGHTNIVESVSYSLDGKYLVSASYDKTIRIWDSTTGALLNTMCGHSDYVHSAFYNKDGNTIVSASKDGTIKVWGIPSLQQLLDETKRRFSKRELTLDERRKYYLE